MELSFGKQTPYVSTIVRSLDSTREQCGYFTRLIVSEISISSHHKQTHFLITSILAQFNIIYIYTSLATFRHTYFCRLVKLCQKQHIYVTDRLVKLCQEQHIYVIDRLVKLCQQQHVYLADRLVKLCQEQHVYVADGLTLLEYNKQVI